MAVSITIRFLFLFDRIKKDIYINKNISIALRKSSTLMYVSQYLFIPLFNKVTNGLLLFLLVTMATFVFSLIIISLSKLKYLKWLHYLYWLFFDYKKIEKAVEKKITRIAELEYQISALKAEAKTSSIVNTQTDFLI